MNDRDEPRSFAWIAFAAVVAGAGLRFWVYARRGSLWLDESSLALNVLARGFGELADPLDWGQAAPVGFLWTEKALVTLLGSAEWVVRLLPFLAGAATPWLAWRVGRRAAGSAAGALASVALAVSLLAIRYSAEAKPYATDALVTLALVHLAFAVLEQPHVARRWVLLGAAGMASVPASLPSAFVLAAIGLALARDAWRQRAAIRALAAGSGAAWLGVFGVLWVLGVREASGTAYLREYWAPVMLDPSAPDFVARLIRAAASATATPLQWSGSIGVALAATGCWLAGVAVVARRDWRNALLLGGPLVVAAAASVAGAYPLSDRLAYFVAPLALVAVAVPAGALIVSLQALLGRAGAAASWLAVAALAAWVGADGARIVRAPGSLESTHALFASVKADAGAGGVPVYVFARAVPAWLYATTVWRAPDRARVARYVALAGSTSGPAHENLSRNRAVRVGEGDTLVYRAGTTTELIGLAPGVRYRIAGPMSAERPSEGWDAVEARRIRAAANPSVWLVASHYFDGTPRDELRPLEAAILQQGMMVEERRAERNAVAIKFVRASPEQARR